MRPKPKIKKNKKDDCFIAYYKGQDQYFKASGSTAMEAMKNWYKKYGSEFGYG